MKTASLVLTKGTIIDGTGGARFRGDVAIRGNYIEAIDAEGAFQGQAANEIDCSGLIIAPGFIDTHSHSDIRALVEPQLPMKVRQGITLEV
ncbi:MAG TPA: D-aminoacylase, partial [Blastocatellia bacterium]